MKRAVSVLRSAARRRYTQELRSFGDLRSFEKKILSQNGEDGIIHEIFFRIGRDRYFVEFGVGDGSECNSALLSLWYGWRGLIIEGDKAYAAELGERYRDRPVTVLSRLVTRENICEIFEEANVPKEFDLLSIDIDGNDYWVWEALSAYRPRLVVIEYNASVAPERFWVMKYNPSHRWEKNQYFGASLSAMTHLANVKGYALIGTDSRSVNAFFVRRDLLDAVGFPERSPRDVYRRPSGTSRLLPAANGPAVTDPSQLQDPVLCGR